jgi:hypothetical protein
MQQPRGLCVYGVMSRAFRAPPGGSLMMSAAQGPVRLSLPDGYVIAAVGGDDVGAIVEVHTPGDPVERRRGRRAAARPVPSRVRRCRGLIGHGRMQHLPRTRVL